MMMVMILVSTQHKVTTKYKKQATPHFSLFVCRGAGQVGFAAGQVDCQVTCPSSRVPVEHLLRSKLCNFSCNWFEFIKLLFYYVLY